MKKNNIILLTILIMLVIYCGAVIFVTKPEGFDISSLFTNTATLSTESKEELKAELKSEIKSELESELEAELNSQIAGAKTELSTGLSDELSNELESKIEALIDEKLEQKISAMTEVEPDYNAIRDQIRNEEISDILSLLED